ncbi:MAG TPA: hypothetical protein VKB93_29255 [Thermoanaerobaculia bacterium]|nr:hypothetical protein [Thermoanaerobaculia bacterium]
MQHFVEQTGWYSVAATSTLDNRGGDYDLSIRCTTSGCLFPYLRTNIPNVTVDRGKQAGIDLDLSVVGPFTSALVDGFTTFATSTTTHLVTPAIFAKQQFIATVDTPCGTTESNIFSVEPRATKLRSARH